MTQRAVRNHHRRSDADRLRVRLTLENLEDRALPSAAAGDTVLMHPFASGHVHPLGTGGPGQPAFYPSDLRTAYGIPGIAGDGTGQTIAIIDAYNNPTIKPDLSAFDAQFGLPDPPSFQVVNQSGGSTLPQDAFPGTWDVEEALDVEWAHAVAPGANILLVEANAPTNASLLRGAVNWARKQPGVSVVSMSFGASEWSSEVTFDRYFKTPSAHNGVTFVASTGDSGAPGGYPAMSPQVLAVGGTSLTLDSNSNWVSETGWSGSGGGQSMFEAKPTFQSKVNTSGFRQIPDVSMDADNNTGVYVLDSWAGGAYEVGGTSLSAPCWAGLIAIADQLRGGALGTLKNVRAQTLLYKLPAGDFHDIIDGNNGLPAGAGYDLVTGRGSPVADVLVPALGSTPGVLPADNSADPAPGNVGADMGGPMLPGLAHLPPAAVNPATWLSGSLASPGLLDATYVALTRQAMGW